MTPNAHKSSRAADERAASRRRFSAAYKLKIVTEAQQCKNPSQVKALLDREGLYPSYLTAWRRQKEKGMLAPMSLDEPRIEEVFQRRLIDENHRLRELIDAMHERLRRAETSLHLQRRVVDLIRKLLQAVDDPGFEVDAAIEPPAPR